MFAFIPQQYAVSRIEKSHLCPKDAGIPPNPRDPGAEAAAGWRLWRLRPVPLADERLGAVIPWMAFFSTTEEPRRSPSVIFQS